MQITKTKQNIINKMDKQNCPSDWIKYITESELPGWYLEGVSRVLCAWFLAEKTLENVAIYFDTLYGLLNGSQKKKQSIFKTMSKDILPNVTWNEKELLDSLKIDWKIGYFHALSYSLPDNGKFSLEETLKIYEKMMLFGRTNKDGMFVSTRESDLFEEVMKLQIREAYLAEPLTFEKRIRFATTTANLEEEDRLRYTFCEGTLVRRAIEGGLTVEEMASTNLDVHAIDVLCSKKNFQWLLDSFDFNMRNLMFYQQYYKEGTKAVLEALTSVKNNHMSGDIYLMEPCVTMSADVKGKAVNIVLMKSNKIRCSYRGYEGVNGDHDVLMSYDLLLYSNGSIFEKKNNKYLPVTYRTLKRIRTNMFEPGEKLYKAIINHLVESGTYVAKDLDKYLYSNEDNYKYYDLIPSFTINETLGCKNLNHLCKKKWKGGQDINWNKMDLNAAYLMMKAKTRIKPEDREKFIQNCSRIYKNKPFVAENTCHSIKDFTDELLAIYLSTMICGDKNDYMIKNQRRDIIYNHSYVNVMYTAKDYVHTQRLLSEKVNINFKSVKKLNEAHDAASAKYEEKDMRVKIPKNSKFKALRKMLPVEMEWIKTAKRLKEEGREMHHCVYSYADKINADACAIYSMTYDDKRYTIEFTKDNDIFEIRQLQSACNQGAPQEVQDYVLNLLKKKQGKVQSNTNITAVRCAGNYRNRNTNTRRTRAYTNNNWDDDFWDEPF